MGCLDDPRRLRSGHDRRVPRLLAHDPLVSHPQRALVAARPRWDLAFRDVPARPGLPADARPSMVGVVRDAIIGAVVVFLVIVAASATS